MPRSEREQALRLVRPRPRAATHACGAALLPDPQTQMASIFYMLAILVWCQERDPVTSRTLQAALTPAGVRPSSGSWTPAMGLQLSGLSPDAASTRTPFSSLRKARRCRGRSENKPCGLFDPAQGPRRMLAAWPCFLIPKRKWPAFFTCWPFLFGAQEGTRSRPAIPAPQACGRPSRPCARHAGALLPDPQTQMASIFYMLAILVWCPGRDSNPHEVTR